MNGEIRDGEIRDRFIFRNINLSRIDDAEISTQDEVRGSTNRTADPETGAVIEVK